MEHDLLCTPSSFVLVKESKISNPAFIFIFKQIRECIKNLRRNALSLSMHSNTIDSYGQA